MPQAIEAFQAALLELYKRQRARMDLDHALAYLEMAAALTPDSQRAQQLGLYEQLGMAHRWAADQVEGTARRRGYHEQAGRALERAADLVELDEPHEASLLWLAAEEFDRAGRLGDVRRMLERFVPGRDGHPRMPRALLMLGQAYEGFGDLERALGWYRRVIRSYPRLEEAARAKVLSAKALASQGKERFGEAEDYLSALLAEDFVAPDSPVYRDALLALCNLLYDQGRYAEAIGRLEDFQALYPEDSNRLRCRFMLANAYRRSAARLRDDPPEGALPGAVAAESVRRFRLAADLYDKLLDDFELAEGLDAAQALYERLALFYRGDCLYELNDPETLRAALATYRNAAARYEGHPSALTAHLQIANIHLRLGQPVEAARALERARWLLRGVTDEAFVRYRGLDRAAWEDFLTTVLSSDLFAGAYAATP
jgi:tetratricopeptide (TPR) repeat protein